MVVDYRPIATPEAVAIWIVDQVRRRGRLDERLGAAKARRLFGHGFTRRDRAFGRDVFEPDVIAALDVFPGCVTYDASGGSFIAEQGLSRLSARADQRQTPQIR